MPSRYSDRSLAGQFTWVRRQTNYSTGVVTITNYGPLTEAGGRRFSQSIKSRSWNNTFGWKAFRAANGYLPTQAMSELQVQSRQPWPTVTYVQRTALEEDRRTIYGNSVACPAQADATFGFNNNSLLGQVQSDAQQKCLAKARDMRVNVAVALGEGRQTVRMIADTARTLGKSYRNFRRGRFKQAAKDLGIQKPAGAAANHWLAYSYGWMPLVSDCVGLVELAAQQLGLGGRPPRLRVRSTSRAEPRKIKYTYVGQGPQCLSDGDSTVEGTFTCEGSAGLLLELKFEAAALAAQLGFGLTDPLLVAWELTPFSFVFDWFVDIGSWLESMSSLQGWTVKTGFSSTRQDFAGTARQSRIWSGWTQEGVVPPVPVKLRKYARIPWTGSIPSIRSPLYDGLNARRIVTSAALWRQRTRGDRVPGKYRP